MKSAKPPPTPADAPSHRRSQPSRQARTNPSRRPANAARAGDGGNAPNGGRALGAQPVDILPAITHFADSMSALPKELVRHFTLLKEVDAKIFAPEEQLFKLVAATRESRLPEPRTADDATNTPAPSGSAPPSVQNSCSGTTSNQAPPLSAAGAGAGAASAASVSSTAAAPSNVFDPANIPRRQLFRQTAFKIKEMLVSLEEKNHVLSTANEALQRQLARVEDVWPYLEKEFSDEAKWGSTTHWAYPENRASGKVSQTERMRRDGAAAISAAAQALAEEAAARSDARKQAVQARKSLKNQHQDSDADDVEKRQKEGPKKTGKSRKSAAAAAAAATDTNHASLGVPGSTSNGAHPPKRRRVEKTVNGDKATGAVATDNHTNAITTNATTPTTTAAPTSAPASTSSSSSAPAVSSTAAASTTTPSSSANNTTSSATAGTTTASTSTAAGSDASKPKTSSPRGTPAPDGQKKRKALPTGSGPVKKKNGLSPSATTSPVMGAIPDPKSATRASPAPGAAPRSTPSRDRQNSIQPNADTSRARPPSSAPINKTNGHVAEAHTSEQASSAPFPKTGVDGKPSMEADASIKATEAIKGETENTENAPSPTMTTTTTTTTTTPSTISKKDSKPEEADSKSEAAPRPVPPTTTKKSGRASKPSTPALATFQEAAASRSRPSRAVEGNNNNNNNNSSSSSSSSSNNNNNNSSNGSSSSNSNSGSSNGNNINNSNNISIINNSSSSSSNSNNSNSRKSHKKAGSVAQQALIQRVQAADTDASRSMQGDDDEGDIDADEPTYCYCNSVSYGEMVACDADGCEREWFHLACVGLKVAPGSKTKWYCEDCKDRLKMGSKKAGRDKAKPSLGSTLRFDCSTFAHLLSLMLIPGTANLCAGSLCWSNRGRTKAAFSVPRLCSLFNLRHHKEFSSWLVVPVLVARLSLGEDGVHLARSLDARQLQHGVSWI
ncbi:hypothetical protein E4U42_001048 [Claviceps africana]|uniref:Chromatin modification-related protein n=1 Tax=Claviceps africana TaxID=83212 RepID=A0A8K0JEG4_9HYPO|nr:hypothetical protein E4U42_001048 [Claviceps africana]